MTTREYMTPGGGLTADAVRDALALAGAEVPAEAIEQWTEGERMMAYDWAMRQYLRASDTAVRRRPKPWFVRVSASGAGLEAVRSWEGWLASLEGSQRQIGQDLSISISAARRAISALSAENAALNGERDELRRLLRAATDEGERYRKAAGEALRELTDVALSPAGRSHRAEDVLLEALRGKPASAAPHGDSS